MNYYHFTSLLDIQLKKKLDEIRFNNKFDDSLATTRQQDLSAFTSFLIKPEWNNPYFTN